MKACDLVARAADLSSSSISPDVYATVANCVDFELDRHDQDTGISRFDLRVSVS